MANDLLTDIKLFLAETGMGKSYFGKAACGNSELVERLESGRRVWPDTEEKVRAFITERRARPSSTATTEGAAA